MRTKSGRLTFGRIVDNFVDVRKKGRKMKLFLIILLALILLFYTVLVSYIFIKFRPMVNKHVDFEEVWEAGEFGLTSNHFFVKTEDGFNISTYEVNVEEPRAVIVCISGIHNPSVTAYFGHARLFKKYNYSSILFDMRAHGVSDGNIISMGFKEYLDTKAIVEYIKKQPCYVNKPIVVMGLSMGAATAINSIDRIPEIDGVISLSSYSSFVEVFRDSLLKKLPKALSALAIPFIHIATFIKYGVSSRINPKNEIKKLGKRPCLLIHSMGDSEVPFLSFHRIKRNAPSHIKTFVVEGDKHLIIDDFTKPEEDEKYADCIVDFIEENF